MKIEVLEMHWLDAHQSLTMTELADLSGLSAEELGELVDCGVLRPRDVSAAKPDFGADCLTTARTAARLRADFGLHPTGLALALTLLQQVHELQAQLCDLRAQSPRHDR